MTRLPRFTLCLLIASGVSSCLPDDTRPPAGRLDVTTSPAQPLEAFETSDGWTIAYDRVLITLGEIDLDGDDCSVYNEVDYLRVISLGDQAAKVSTPYARGRCDFAFQMRPPTQDAVLGSGVTEADYRLVGEPRSDAYTDDAGTALFVSGRATSGSREKRFAWAFRRGFQYESCEVDGSPGIQLTGDESKTVDLTIHTRGLFAVRPDDDGELRFAPFALADDDGDGDGEVTLTELMSVSYPFATEYPDWQTLGDYVYLGRAPRVPRFQGTGACEIGPYVEDDDGP